MSEEEKTEVQEKLLTTVWKNFKDEPPPKPSIIIVLTKHGMHFYYYRGIDDPLNTMCGLFWVRSDQNCSGLRYSIEVSDLISWTPLPEAYIS